MTDLTSGARGELDFFRHVLLEASVEDSDRKISAAVLRLSTASHEVSRTVAELMGSVPNEVLDRVQQAILSIDKAGAAVRRIRRPQVENGPPNLPAEPLERVPLIALIKTKENSMTVPVHIHTRLSFRAVDHAILDTGFTRSREIPASDGTLVVTYKPEDDLKVSSLPPFLDSPLDSDDSIEKINVVLRVLKGAA